MGYSAAQISEGLSTYAARASRTEEIESEIKKDDAVLFTSFGGVFSR